MTTHTQSSVIRWGLIGCGQIAVDKSLLGLLSASGARLAALSDPLEQRRALALSAAHKAGVADVCAYEDYASLLDDANVDAVYIALPTGMHAEAVFAAAAANKAILCEKPLGRNADEVRTMASAAQAAGVPLMTAYMSRFSDVFQRAAQLLAEGAIGQITYVSCDFSYPALGPYPPGAPGGWRWTDAEGGGPLLDIGVYLAFGLRELLGERITRAGAWQCDTVAPPNLPVRDTTFACFQTASGIPGTFAATFSHKECRISFYGAKGRLDLENCFSQTPGGRVAWQTGDGYSELNTLGAAGLPHFDNYRREFEHFSHALLKRTSYSPSPEDALADALLLDALNHNLGASVMTPVADAKAMLEVAR
jgi:predicted dehydrogenase